MSHKRFILRKLLDTGELEEECLPGQCVLELIADGRVLIENHHCILCYAPQQVSIRTSFGEICVKGSNLQLRHMARRKLLITGKIDAIELHRRKSL